VAGGVGPLRPWHLAADQHSGRKGARPGPRHAGNVPPDPEGLAGRRPGAPFYLDNLRVTEHPEDASLPTTSAAIPVE